MNSKLVIVFSLVLLCSLSEILCADEPPASKYQYEFRLLSGNDEKEHKVHEFATVEAALEHRERNYIQKYNYICNHYGGDSCIRKEKADTGYGRRQEWYWTSYDAHKAHTSGVFPIFETEETAQPKAQAQTTAEPQQQESNVKTEL